MKMERPRPSTLAWGALGAAVTAYELLCPPGETLSERLDPLLEKPATRAAVIGMVGVTALHLCNALPKGVDPYYQLTRLKERE